MGLAVLAALPAGVASAAGGGESHSGICGPHSVGFAGVYCLWDESGDNPAGEDSNRSVERGSPGR